MRSAPGKSTDASGHQTSDIELGTSTAFSASDDHGDQPNGTKNGPVVEAQPDRNAQQDDNDTPNPGGLSISWAETTHDSSKRKALRIPSPLDRDKG